MKPDSSKRLIQVGMKPGMKPGGYETAEKVYETAMKPFLETAMKPAPYFLPRFYTAGYKKRYAHM